MALNNTLIALAAKPGDTTGELHFGTVRMPCAFGRSGLTHHKREGDGGTPIGVWPLRELYYRPDRIVLPDTKLRITKIKSTDGWSDAPESTDYNKYVLLPYDHSHEKLWRDDHLYDLMIPMGYNDQDIVPNKGSAIFFHLAKDDYQPTEGCVAISKEHMLDLLPYLGPNTMLKIEFDPVVS